MVAQCASQTFASSLTGPLGEVVGESTGFLVDLPCEISR